MDKKQEEVKNVVNSQQRIQGPKITPEMIKNSQALRCDCGGMLFVEKLVFKRLSSILSPTGKDETIPMPVIVCENCGKVPTIFDPQNLMPKELKATNNKPGKKTLKIVK